MLHSNAVITQGRLIVTLINTFTVEPDYQEAVVESLTRATETIMQGLPGFIGASVHKSLDGRYVANYAQWESEAQFHAMFQNPDAKAHMEEVTALAVSVLPILYTVAYVGDAEEVR